MRSCSSFGGISSGGFASANAFSDLGGADGRRPDRSLSLSLEVSEVFTDNVSLADTGNEESEFITIIAPRLSLCHESRRSVLTLEYRPQALLYADNSQLNRVNHNAAAALAMELLSNHFFVDAETRYAQQVVEPSLGFARSDFLNPDNQSDQWRIDISPYFEETFGSFARGTLRYRHGRVINESSTLPDTVSDGVYGQLANFEDRGDWSWQLSASSVHVRETGNDSRAFFRQFQGEDQGSRLAESGGQQTGASSTHFGQATAEAGYRVSESLQLVALAGVENDYQENGEVDRYGSSRWNAGFQWRSGGASLEARAGRRFFGTDYLVNAGLAGRLLSFTASYREIPTTSGLAQLNTGGGNLGGRGLFSTASQLNRGVFLQKRTEGTTTLSTALTRSNLQVFREERNYLSGIPDETLEGISLNSSYEIAPRTSLIAYALYQGEDNSGVGEYSVYESGLDAVRLVGPTTRASLGYARVWRTGDGRDYTANQITLLLSKDFL